jgi:BirA family biotin operon repressor/biotin-[acetyl-CoA-carboxylase] ligase
LVSIRYANAHNSPIAVLPTKRGVQISGTSTDGRLGRIVRLLSDNATIVVSGTRIAEELRTSRSEVWRSVQQLRELGVQIAGHPATGYQLQAMPDLLLPEILGPLVQGNLIGNRIHHYFTIGSTNTEAMSAAAAGETEGAVFLAEEQTAGRGRADHSWESQPSVGIYCSSILRPPLAPADAISLSLMAGLAVAEAVEQTTGLRPDLRWPNDVLLKGRKFCGILTEMHAEATRVRYVVIGIGINVNNASFPAELQPIATSLRLESGREWSRVELTAALLKSLDNAYHKFIEGGAQGRTSLFRKFEEGSSFARSRRVHIEEDGGYEGTTEGLDDRGFLRVRTLNGLKTLLSGTVRAIGDGK